MINNIKARAHELKPTIWVGKNGINESLYDEIKKQLNKNKLVKVKILGSAIDEQDIDRKKVPDEIAKEVGAELIQKVGFVFTLYKNTSSSVSDSTRAKSKMALKKSISRISKL